MAAFDLLWSNGSYSTGAARAIRSSATTIQVDPSHLRQSII
jgi:hypothetical protein